MQNPCYNSKKTFAVTKNKVNGLELVSVLISYILDKSQLSNQNISEKIIQILKKKNISQKKLPKSLLS